MSCSNCGDCHVTEGYCQDCAAEIAESNRRANQTITDLAILVRKLLTRKKPWPEERKAQFWDYLKRHGLEGSILRDSQPDAATESEVK